MREAIAIEAALEGRRASWWSHKVAYGAGCRAVDNGCGSCRGISEVTMRTDTTCTANTTRGLVQRAHSGTHKHYYMRVRASCTPFFPPRNAVNESNGQSSDILACIASRNCPGGSSREATSSSRPKLSEAYRGMHVEACGHRARTISATSSATDLLPAFQRPAPNGGLIHGPSVPQRVQQEALWRLAANALPMPGPCFALRRHGKRPPTGTAFRRAMVWERVAGHKRMFRGVRLAEGTGR